MTASLQSQPLSKYAGATQAGNLLNLPDSAWIDGYALKLFGCVRMTSPVRGGGLYSWGPHAPIR
jgi:hypothetical protein